MWSVEVWVYPVRDPNGRLLRQGTWKGVGSADTFEEAKEAVIEIAEKHGIARASQEDAEMRASKGRGFYWWRYLK